MEIEEFKQKLNAIMKPVIEKHTVFLEAMFTAINEALDLGIEIGKSGDKIKEM